MKLQLINAENINESHYYGDNLLDPISVKKLSVEEKEVYRDFGITHVLDMRSLLTLYEIYFLKYITKHDNKLSGKDLNETIKLNFFNIKTIKNCGQIKPFEVWSENLNLKGSKKPAYVKYMEFLQSEIPILNYHLYNLTFTKLNAISYEEWVNSFNLIATYMEAYTVFADKNKDMLEKLSVKITTDKCYSTDFEFLGHQNSSSKTVAVIANKLLSEAYLEQNKVFWNKERKKEERIEVKNAPLQYMKQLIALGNWHYENYAIFKSIYDLKDLKEIKDNKENILTSLIDMHENLSYQQFYFEAVLARSLSNTFDPLEVQDFNVLVEHGVRRFELHKTLRELLGNKYGTPYLYQRNNGRDKLKENFERFYRELCINNKLDNIDSNKEISTAKKKI